VAAKDPDQLDLFSRGEPVGFLKGKESTVGLDVFSRGEPAPALIVTIGNWAGATASTYTFAATTAGVATHFGATASTWTLNATDSGAATHYGTTASTWTLNATAAGTRTRLGSTATTETLTITTAGVATHYAATASTWTLSRTTAGVATHYGATATTITFNATDTGASTHYGATSSTWTLNAATAAFANYHGATASVWTLSITTGTAPEATPTLVTAPKRPLYQQEGIPLHLEAGTARILVRALAPQLRIGVIIASPALRMRANACTTNSSLTIEPAAVDTIYRAQRDPQSIDLDRELAILLEA
jgi:hypothetical protein